MTDYLADGNLLIALTVNDHVHHDAALAWFESRSPTLATCPITQGTLLRFLLREGVPLQRATSILASLTTQTWHRFWPDELAFDPLILRGVIGHRQVTDAYLVGLATHFGGVLATLDSGLAALHGNAVDLLETGASAVFETGGRLPLAQSTSAFE